MMNKMLLLAGVAATLLSVNANAAEFSQYVAVRGIYSDMSNDGKVSWSDEDESGTDKFNVDDKVWGGSLAYGIKSGAIRAEIEGNLFAKASNTYTDTEDDEEYSTKFSVKHQSLMFNAYYDIDTGTRFTPYVGAGLGYAHLKAKVNDDEESFSKSANNLAWQLGAGVSYAATDNISVDLGYRYTDYGSLTRKYSDEEESGKMKIDSDANEFYLGVRYAF